MGCETVGQDGSAISMGEQPEWKSWIRKRISDPIEEPVATNVDVVGFSDMDGRVDGQQLQFQTVGDNHYLYVGHPFSGGITVLDVTTPSDPQVVVVGDASQVAAPLEALGLGDFEVRSVQRESPVSASDSAVPRP